eukprot:CAMPEP_0168621568 /NCGR_PEP_ID=MMETSP0449_2-20121227/7769_1 /TAXON_ID=1082188 /ORGANISM="Strombidium rassoulzadegani, Strain ras09" /LENGTH=106 /DNA_ID=CAMNT_0008662707 /DNA_START=136 /DNA_END=456 /DNA_ORIENTATION=-
MEWQSHNMVANKPKFVVFFSENCPQCRKMHQAWIDLAQKLKGNLNVLAVSRDYNLDAMKSLQVFKYPTIRLYKGASDKDFVEFTQSDDGHDLTEESFLSFLQKNGV